MRPLLSSNQPIVARLPRLRCLLKNNFNRAAPAYMPTTNIAQRGTGNRPQFPIDEIHNRFCRQGRNVLMARYSSEKRFIQRGATERTCNMRMITKAALALGFVGAMSASAFEPAKAQGVYLSGPGVNVQVGDPDWRYRHHRRYYRDYDRSYAYAPGPRYRHGCPRGFSVQDGVCKPYRGY